jgi:hypothetical protein
MTEHEDQESPIYQIEGPVYQDGAWTAIIRLKERTSDTFHGETREEVQEQMLRYLGQQALEIEKARILLRKAFESQSEQQGSSDYGKL